MGKRATLLKIVGGAALAFAWLGSAQAQNPLVAHTAPEPTSNIPGGRAPAAVASSPNADPALHVVNASTPFTVGRGDVLGISVWKEKELSPTVVVRPDGNISVPLIGEMTVLGMTPVGIEEVLRKRLESIVVNPQVTVTVVEIHSRIVYITGEVARPGAYPLNAPIDVLQLIAQAGGLTEFAARTKIRIVRANVLGKGTPFNYTKVLRSGEQGDSMLQPGDTVVVP